MKYLRRANVSTLLLLDASDQPEVAATVRQLRDKGWKYVIVVAADPSGGESVTVLRGGLGFDYWNKTYDEEKIRAQLLKCLEEILEAPDPKNPAEGSGVPQ
jgi:hypothetical protein